MCSSPAQICVRCVRWPEGNSPRWCPEEVEEGKDRWIIAHPRFCRLDYRRSTFIDPEKSLAVVTFQVRQEMAEQRRKCNHRPERVVLPSLDYFKLMGRRPPYDTACRVATKTKSLEDIDL